MTEERIIEEISRVQNRILAWILVGLTIGLILGWIMGVTIGEMHSAGNTTSSDKRVLQMDSSDLGSHEPSANTSHRRLADD